ncbi:uncharacterized protein LOC129591879 [Paramacrobiotus metropolitanus]|uniref:uncharacterized protein LOC129591879 n=1 Tax=Paramacrobiotus metropolitanus TaxID=2943436 RepID=UPI0024460B07|nr:uncharacterized protein LOC129591879 [Paramacrobiotus metropolitanus]
MMQQSLDISVLQFVSLCMCWIGNHAQAVYWSDPGDSTLVLEAGGEIRPYSTPIYSPSGKYKVMVSSYALMVMRLPVNSKKLSSTVVWSTMADGHSVSRLELTQRGNLYLWGTMDERNNATLWRSNSPLTRTGLYQPVLSLTDDGYLQLSIDGEVYWESTGLREYACLNNASLSNRSAEVLQRGQVLTPGKKYYSPNKNFYLILQDDGNMVVYRDCDSTPTFSSYTHSATPDNVTVTSRGEFIYYGDMGGWGSIQMWFKEPQFKYGETGRPNSELRLADNGRLYLCQSGDCYWQSGIQYVDVDDLTHLIKLQEAPKGTEENKAPVAARAIQGNAAARDFASALVITGSVLGLWLLLKH